MEEMNVMPKFESEAEVYEWVMSQMVATEGDELSEDALDMVAGGMSTVQALKIISTAYWDYGVQRKKKSSYSSTQIVEAIKICEKYAKSVGQNYFNWIRILKPIVIR